MMEQLENVFQTQSRIVSSNNISFLLFAVEAGLVYFVASNLDLQPELLTLWGPSIFEAALRMRIEGYQYVTALAPMVQMLLKRGLNPNRLLLKQDSQSLFVSWLEVLPYVDTGRVEVKF
jgi:hypothetical protein